MNPGLNAVLFQPKRTGTAFRYHFISRHITLLYGFISAASRQSSIFCSRKNTDVMYVRGMELQLVTCVGWVGVQEVSSYIVQLLTRLKRVSYVYIISRKNLV